jgi:signal peptidase
MRVVARVTGVVAIMVLGWLFWLPASLGGYMTYAVVSGQSMQPTYYTGDFVVARAQPSYEVGDVVAFRTEDEDVIHRIVGGDSESGYITQGDNNAELDRWVPTAEEIRGKSVLRLPGVGPSVLVLNELVTTSPFLQVLAGMLVLAAALREFWKSRLRTSGHVAA